MVLENDLHLGMKSELRRLLMKKRKDLKRVWFTCVCLSGVRRSVPFVRSHHEPAPVQHHSGGHSVGRVGGHQWPAGLQSEGQSWEMLMLSVESSCFSARLFTLCVFLHSCGRSNRDVDLALSVSWSDTAGDKHMVALFPLISCVLTMNYVVIQVLVFNSCNSTIYLFFYIKYLF